MTMTCPTPEPTRADVPRLITTWRHYRSEAERNATEARAIEATLRALEATLRALLPPDDPALLALMKKGK